MQEGFELSDSLLVKDIQLGEFAKVCDPEVQLSHGHGLEQPQNHSRVVADDVTITFKRQRPVLFTLTPLHSLKRKGEESKRDVDYGVGVEDRH